MAAAEPTAAAVPATVAVAPATAVVVAAAVAGACGVGCAAGTSVALLSGSAMEMSESRRSSFSVSSELRRMTGCESMFISWPSGEASRLMPAPSASPAPPRGTVFMEALPLRLTFMLSNFTSRSQKSVEMPRDWAVPTEQEDDELPPPMLMALWEAEERAEDEELPWERQLELEEVPHRRESRSEEEETSRSLQRCWVKWLGNTCTHTDTHTHNEAPRTEMPHNTEIATKSECRYVNHSNYFDLVKHGTQSVSPLKPRDVSGMNRPWLIQASEVFMGSGILGGISSYS